MSFLKNRDIFGHQISMNFDNKNPTHNTLIGGLFTQLTYFMIVGILVFKTIRVVTYENPDLSSITGFSPEDLIVDHEFPKLNLLNFYNLKKQNSGHL